MNTTEETFEIRSCVVILANDIKIYTINVLQLIKNYKNLQGIHNGGSSSLRDMSGLELFWDDYKTFVWAKR